MEAKKKSNLSIVHIDTTSSSGGAAKVARRLAEAQRHSGYRSGMLVGIKEGNSPYSVSFESNPDPFMVSRYKRKGLLDYEFRGSHELMNNRRIGNADIIHFHNLHGSYFNPFSIVLLSNIKPSVWTLHDMQSFTGHCAHSFDCEGWMEGCPKCRFLSWYPHINEDSASALWMDKKWIYDNSRLHIVTPSKWLKEKVEKSILKNHPVHLIYNGINTSIFKPNNDKKRIREELGFPENAFLFGSAAKGGIFESFFKGGNYAKQVVAGLTSERKDSFFINICARCKSNIANVIDVPWVADEHFLSKVLSVLDAFIFTSIAENCPLAVLEALACGLPVVAFSIGGVPELVREGIDGFLMARGDWRSMVTVLKKLADEPDLRRQIGINTRARVLEEFDHAGVTERYEKLYHDCLSKWEDNSQGREVVGDYPEIVLSAPFAGYRSRLEKIFRVETTNSLASSGFLEVKKDEIPDTGDEGPGKLYQRIQEMIRDGEQNKAMVGLEKLLESDPDYALAHNDLGVLYYNAGEKEKALNHYRKAAELQPENITFQKNLADFYYVELSQVEEAMQIYVKVLNANPEDVETLLIIGQICVAIKKFDDAKDFYSRILIVDPWNKDAKQFLEELEKCQLSVTGDRLGSEDIETASKEYLVSAIVSTYNSERFLRGCLEDLEAQTIADRMEVIVVNSGTEQNEETIVREFQQRYNNIKYIKTDDRETVYQAWNRGIRASKAKYITNANTDDRRYADSIEVLVNVLEENPYIVLAYGNFKVTDTENCISGNANIIEEMDYQPYERGTLLRSCYPGPMPVWRKSVHDEFGYFNESFVSAGDREFWCRISQKYSLLHVEKHIGVYYRNPEGIENRNKRSGIVQQEAERISRRYAKSFQLPWNDFRRINFHIEDNFPETKRALQELESSGGGFHVHVQISSCDLGEYLWLRQKRNEGLVHELRLTEEGKRKFPSVAILMFTYNRLEYTQEALHTLMRNTRYPFDLYIIDNHSTDGTREWLEAVRLEYPDRIKDIRYNSTNEGLPGPTNDFWSRVDSELIGKVDNDTLVPTGWLERLVEAHQKISELAVIGGYHFRSEDFDDKSARSKLYEHDGIKILPDAHIGGCCYLMKKSQMSLIKDACVLIFPPSFQKIFDNGPMPYIGDA